MQASIFQNFNKNCILENGRLVALLWRASIQATHNRRPFEVKRALEVAGFSTRRAAGRLRRRFRICHDDLKLQEMRFFQIEIGFIERENKFQWE